MEDKNLTKKKFTIFHNKQLFFIILLTVIMIFSSLVLSFSAVHLISGSKNMNYNSIIVKIPSSNDNDPELPPTDLLFNYKELDTIGNGINLTDLFPVSDSVGMTYKGLNHVFSFRIYCGDKAINRYYEITAERLEFSNLDPRYVKIYLESESLPLTPSLNENGKIRVFSEYDNATVNLKNKNEKWIYQGKINKKDIINGYREFTLKMWISEDAIMNSSTMDKKFAVRINVYTK